MQRQTVVCMLYAHACMYSMQDILIYYSSPDFLLPWFSVSAISLEGKQTPRVTRRSQHLVHPQQPHSLFSSHVYKAEKKKRKKKKGAAIIRTHTYISRYSAGCPHRTYIYPADLWAESKRQENFNSKSRLLLHGFLLHLPFPHGFAATDSICSIYSIHERYRLTAHLAECPSTKQGPASDRRGGPK